MKDNDDIDLVSLEQLEENLQREVLERQLATDADASGFAIVSASGFAIVSASGFAIVSASGFAIV